MQAEQFSVGEVLEEEAAMNNNIVETVKITMMEAIPEFTDEGSQEFGSPDRPGFCGNYSNGSCEVRSPDIKRDKKQGRGRISPAGGIPPGMKRLPLPLFLSLNS